MAEVRSYDRVASQAGAQGKNHDSLRLLVCLSTALCHTPPGEGRGERGVELLKRAVVSMRRLYAQTACGPPIVEPIVTRMVQLG